MNPFIEHYLQTTFTFDICKKLYYNIFEENKREDKEKMKIKKLKKIFPGYEIVRIWGRNEEYPIYYGTISGIPKFLKELEMLPGDEGSLIEIRYNCSDIEDHIAVFVEEEGV